MKTNSDLQQSKSPPHKTRDKLLCIGMTLCFLAGPAIGKPPTHHASVVAASKASEWGGARQRARIFISGHSLTDDPYGEQLIRISNSLGDSTSAKFNQQIGIGSPIRLRTGMPKSLDGYATGKPRPNGKNINVLEEFATGKTIDGDRYDSLVITENHNLLEMIQWENTVRQIRHFHDKLVSFNPLARTFLYASWWQIDKSQPQKWMDTERAVAKAWHCVGARINASLALEGRTDRVLPLPTSLALADLLERILVTPVPELQISSAREAVNLVFRDNVHLTQMGVYYTALVSYVALFERSPVGAWYPPEVDGRRARALQQAAWEFTSDFYKSYKDPMLASCVSVDMPTVCEAYLQFRGRQRELSQCRQFFQANSPLNPFRFDEASDATYWFPER